MRRLIAALLTLVLLAGCVPPAGAEGLQLCHQVTLTHTDTTQANGSVVRLWHAQTALESVDAEINALAEDYAARYGADLPKAANKTEKNSRLDVEIRYSRTGLKWLSFMVQARQIYHRDLTGQFFTTRTFDMTTGERVTLTDLFDADSAGWAVLADAVRSQCAAYFTEELPEESALEALCAREALEQAEFTLHGMSLVLHYGAETLYPGHRTLMEVTLMYPEIRPYMTAEAQAETDNLAYYKTCALTFDDGPVRTNTTLVLQAMMTAGCRGTFFVLGNRIAKYDDLVQREHDEGHAVATHNWTHANVNKVSVTTLKGYVTKCNKALDKAIGLTPKYDRVPYGLYPKMIKAKTGWPLIQWSVDTYDWRGRSTANVVAKVKREISDGDIILCHDIKDNTPASAEQICRELMDMGYMLLTVDELFAKDGVTLQPDTVYFRCTGGDTSIKEK